MAGQSIRIQPDEFTKEQHHRVGIVAPDQWGKLWTYCLFAGGDTDVSTFNIGELLIDSVSPDLISGTGIGTLTSAAGVGTNQLKDTGEFAGKDLRGAIGVIYTNDGKGQVFQVLKVLDDDTLQIALLWDDSGKAGDGKKGWATALTTSSTYQIMFPGRVKKSSTITPFFALNRGVIQDALTVPAKEVRYGWALQQGLGIVAHNTNSQAIVQSSYLTAGDDTAGQIESAALVSGTSPTTVAAVLNATRRGVNAIGRGILQIDTPTAPAYIDIRNNMLSYRFPIKDQPYSKDDQGNLVL